MLAQSLKERGEPVLCLDTDPVNKSFSAIGSLGVERVELLDRDAVNVEAMNDVMSRIADEDTNVVMDNGAASFLPLLTYLLDTGLLDWLAAKGKRIVVHVPIIGTEALADTALCLEMMAEKLPAHVEIVPWLNPYFAPLVTNEGTPFEDTDLFQHCASRFAATIRIPELNPRYSGACVKKMTKAAMTFDDARHSPQFSVISKLWLEQAWSGINTQIEGVV